MKKLLGAVLLAALIVSCDEDSSELNVIMDSDGTTAKAVAVEVVREGSYSLVQTLTGEDNNGTTEYTKNAEYYIIKNDITNSEETNQGKLVAFTEGTPDADAALNYALGEGTIATTVKGLTEGKLYVNSKVATYDSATKNVAVTSEIIATLGSANIDDSLELKVAGGASLVDNSNTNLAVITKDTTLKNTLKTVEAYNNDFAIQAPGSNGYVTKPVSEINFKSES